jgi:hypothetical protein
MSRILNFRILRYVYSCCVSREFYIPVCVLLLCLYTTETKNMLYVYLSFLVLVLDSYIVRRLCSIFIVSPIKLFKILVYLLSLLTVLTYSLLYIFSDFLDPELFNPQMNTANDTTQNTTKPTFSCQTLRKCFLSISYAAMLGRGNLSKFGILKQFFMEDSLFYQSQLIAMLMQLIVGVCILWLILYSIINEFGEIRYKNRYEKLQLDQECLICGIEKEQLDI